MWLSLFPVRSSRTTDRSAGLYGVAFVDYQEGSTLTYQELLVARLIRGGGVPRVRITDIWVNSTASRDGGRSLWAIPKELADVEVNDTWLGLGARTSWEAKLGRSPVASARFTGVRGAPLRTPFRFSTSQQRDAGSMVQAKVSGSAKSLPCLGKWDFAEDGPLSWLRGRSPALSFRLSEFRLTFGG